MCIVRKELKAPSRRPSEKSSASREGDSMIATFPGNSSDIHSGAAEAALCDAVADRTGFSILWMGTLKFQILVWLYVKLS